MRRRFDAVRQYGGALAWRRAYLRSVRSAFATVPFYRERWALDGRTEPVLVPGREGTNGGAASAAQARRMLVDLVPLAGGPAEHDPVRGLGRVLPADPGAGLVVVAAGDVPLPPTDLPPGLRGCLIDPGAIAADVCSGALGELTDTLRRGDTAIAVGDEKALTRVVEALPDRLGHRLRKLPWRRLDAIGEVDHGPFGVLYDPLLGYLGYLGDCGRWHLDHQHVYARSTAGGLAFTLLRQDSPRFVDILIAEGVRAKVEHCPRHGTPVVLP